MRVSCTEKEELAQKRNGFIRETKKPPKTYTICPVGVQTNNWSRQGQCRSEASRLHRGYFKINKQNEKKDAKVEHSLLVYYRFTYIFPSMCGATLPSLIGMSGILPDCPAETRLIQDIDHDYDASTRHEM